MGNDASQLLDLPGACVKGCYRCLLSYFNQPDHEQIDRTDIEAKQLLVALARGQVQVSASGVDRDLGWPAAFLAAGLPDPEIDKEVHGGLTFAFSWRSHYVLAHPNQIGPEARAAAEVAGWIVFELPSSSFDVPAALVSNLES